ncbi:MAG: hypothetical protein ABR571_02470 [Jatrophihabitans sp.]|uniref:hypothetical protein n=1 Tax=Jatrophihabitans sp. TaxID=1932789 RepID=UPI0039119B87
MSYPNPPGEQPAYQPAPGYGPPPSGPTRLRGRTPLRLGWIFLALAIVLFVVGGVTGKKSLSKVNNFQRVTILTSPPTSEAQLRTITFTKAGGYLAYYEASDVSSSITKIPEPVVRMLSPSGKELDLKTPYGNRSDNKIKRLTYDYKGHKGVAVWQFHISETGKYKVFAGYTAAPPGAKMAFGTSIAKSTVIAGLLIVLGVLFLIAAIVLLIVGFVKRSRHKKELASGGYGSPAFGGPPPAGQWQQPGGFPPPQQGGFPPHQQGGYQPPPPPPQQ